MDLQVSIPRKAVRYTGYVDVDECISNYVLPESMERCGYKCSKCKQVDNLEKQMTIFRFPKILVVHLKRFYNSTMRREKLSTTINIPQILDARPYATPNSSKFLSLTLTPVLQTTLPRSSRAGTSCTESAIIQAACTADTISARSRTQTTARGTIATTALSANSTAASREPQPALTSFFTCNNDTSNKFRWLSFE